MNLTIFPPKPKAFPVVDNDDITQAQNPEVIANPFHYLYLLNNYFLNLFLKMVSRLHLYLPLTYFKLFAISCWSIQQSPNWPPWLSPYLKPILYMVDEISYLKSTDHVTPFDDFPSHIS